MGLSRGFYRGPFNGTSCSMIQTISYFLYNNYIILERVCQVNSLCCLKYKNGLERQFCGSGEVCEVVGECKNFPQLFHIRLFPGAGRPLHKSKNFPWNFHIKLSPGTGRAWQFDSIYQGGHYLGKCQGMVKLDFCGIFSSD